MQQTQAFFVKALELKLNEYKSRNSSLSNRSFCNKYNIDSGDFSKILAGKKELSAQTMLKWLDQLAIKAEQNKALYSMINNGRDFHIYTNDDLFLKSNLSLKTYPDWYYPSIFTYIADKQHVGAQEISSAFDLELSKTQSILDELTSSELISLTESKYTTLKKSMDFESSIEAHKSFLNKSIDYLDNNSEGDGLFSGITFKMKRSDVDRLSDLITEFMSSVACNNIADEDGEDTDLFALRAQFFPLTGNK